MCLLICSSKTYVLFHVRLRNARSLNKSTTSRIAKSQNYSKVVKSQWSGCLFQHVMKISDVTLLTGLLQMIAPFLVHIEFSASPIYALQLHEPRYALNKVLEFISYVVRPEPAFDDNVLWRAYRYFEEERLKVIVLRLNERISRLEIFLDVISNCKVAAFLNPDIEDKNAVLDGIKATAITVTETATESTATLGIETAAQVLGQASIGVGITVLIDLALTSRSLYMAKKQKDEGIISDKEFSTKVKKKVCESGLQFVGGTTGSIVGQILIPIPVLGAFVGGLCGSLIGTGIGKGINYGIFDKMEKEAEIYGKTGPSVLVGSQLAVLEDVVNRKRRKNLTTLTRFNEELNDFEEVNLQQAFSFLDRILKSYDVSSKKSPKQTSSTSFFPFTKTLDRGKRRDGLEEPSENTNSDEPKEGSSAVKGNSSYPFFFGKLSDKGKPKEDSEGHSPEVQIGEEPSRETAETTAKGSSFFSFNLLGSAKQRKKEEIEERAEVRTTFPTEERLLITNESQGQRPSFFLGEKGAQFDYAARSTSASEPSSPLPNEQFDFESRKKADGVSHIASLKSLLTFDFSSKDIQKQNVTNTEEKSAKKVEEPRRRQLRKRFTLSGISQLTQSKDQDSPKSPTFLEPFGEGEDGRSVPRSPTRQKSFTLSSISPSRKKPVPKDSSQAPSLNESQAKETEDHVSRILKEVRRSALQRQKNSEEGLILVDEVNLENDCSGSDGQARTENEQKEDLSSAKGKKSFRSTLFLEDSFGYLFGNLTRKDSKRKKETSAQANEIEKVTNFCEGDKTTSNDIGGSVQKKSAPSDRSSVSDSPSKFDHIFSRRSFRQQSSGSSFDGLETAKSEVQPTGKEGPISLGEESPSIAQYHFEESGSPYSPNNRGDESIKTSISEGLEKFFGFRVKRNKTENSFELNDEGATGTDKTTGAASKSGLSRSNSERKLENFKSTSELHRSRSERLIGSRRRDYPRNPLELSTNATPTRQCQRAPMSELDDNVFEEEDEEGLLYDSLLSPSASSGSGKGTEKHYVSLYKEKVCSAPERSPERERTSPSFGIYSFDDNQLKARPSLSRGQKIYREESKSGDTCVTYSRDRETKQVKQLRRQQPFMDVCLSTSPSSESSFKEESDSDEQDEDSSLPFMDVAPKKMSKLSKSSDGTPDTPFGRSHSLYGRPQFAQRSRFHSESDYISSNCNNTPNEETTSLTEEETIFGQSDLKEKLLAWVFTKDVKDKDANANETGQGLRRAKTMTAREGRSSESDSQEKRSSGFNFFDFKREEVGNSPKDDNSLPSPSMRQAGCSPTSPRRADFKEISNQGSSTPQQNARPAETSGTPKKSSEFPNLVKALTLFKIPIRQNQEADTPTPDKQHEKVDSSGSSETQTANTSKTQTESRTGQVRTKLKEKQRLIDKIGIFRTARKERSFEEASG